MGASLDGRAHREGVGHRAGGQPADGAGAPEAGPLQQRHVLGPVQPARIAEAGHRPLDDLFEAFLAGPQLGAGLGQAQRGEPAVGEDVAADLEARGQFAQPAGIEQVARRELDVLRRPVSIEASRRSSTWPSSQLVVTTTGRAVMSSARGTR
jgi:hypothetical protein